MEGQEREGCDPYCHLAINPLHILKISALNLASSFTAWHAVELPVVSDCTNGLVPLHTMPAAALHSLHTMKIVFPGLLGKEYIYS